jgi:hypothetical protein
MILKWRKCESNCDYFKILPQYLTRIRGELQESHQQFSDALNFFYKFETKCYEMCLLGIPCLQQLLQTTELIFMKFDSEELY